MVCQYGACVGVRLIRLINDQVTGSCIFVCVLSVVSVCVVILQPAVS